MLQRMDNVGIVVDDLKAATEFFVELGLELEGEMTVEGQWVDRCEPNLSPTPAAERAPQATQSDVVFGLFWLLGYQFGPRLADIGETTFACGR